MTDVSAAPKLYLPGFAGLYQSLAPYGYPIIRFAAGAIIVPHGWAKLFGGFAPFVAERVLTPLGFPAPLAWTYLLGVIELFGAAMLAIGLFTRPIALILSVEFAIITFAAALPNGFFFTNPRGGYEYPLLMLAVFIGILFRGSDRCAVDRLIGKEF